MWQTWQDVLLTLRPATLRNDRIRRPFSLSGRSVVKRITRVLGVKIQERPLTDCPKPHGLGGILEGPYAGGGAAR